MRANEFTKLTEAFKPDQLNQLSQLKRDLAQKQQEKHQQSMAMTPDKQADLDQWAADFAANRGSRTVAQDTEVPAAEPAKADWRTQPRMTKNKVRSEKEKADAIIKYGEFIVKMVDRADKFPGGMSRELQSDLENLENSFEANNTNYDMMLELYSKFAAKLDQFIKMKRALYAKPKRKFEESKIGKDKEAEFRLNHQMSSQEDDTAEYGMADMAKERAGRLKQIAKRKSREEDKKKQSSMAEQFCDDCGGSLAEAGKASRSLCLSSKPNDDLGASQLSSCKSQGLRSRETSKKHTIANKRVKIKGKKVKGHEYGGPLPYNKSDKTK